MNYLNNFIRFPIFVKNSTVIPCNSQPESLSLLSLFANNLFLVSYFSISKVGQSILTLF